MSMRVKVLATTDLHAHLLPFDYFTDRPAPCTGLASLAPVIAEVRKECRNVLLLDNGDTLQGAPLADAACEVIVANGKPHPMYATMSNMGFDAATLGNHDFDFGIPLLRRALQAASFPVVSANAIKADGTPFVPSSAVLERQFTDDCGTRHRVRIGITGGLPPQVALWNKRFLDGQVSFDPMVETIKAQVAHLKAEGADLVFALAHSGLGVLGAPSGAENAAAQVAELDGVDVVVAGHTHKVRPPKGESLHRQSGAALVQPGANGSHLGLVDLTLEPDGDGGWTVARSVSAVLGARLLEMQDGREESWPSSRCEVMDSHAITRAFVARPLGRSAMPLETYFSTLAPCAATQVVADAQSAAARPLVADQPALKGLRLLSAVAPFKSGGRAGPQSYSDIAEGPLRLRHAADLYLYPNVLSLLRITGAGLREWLERSASIYHRIDPKGAAGQTLINEAFAPYNFDRITGLTYDIDVSAPARSSADGETLFDTPGRIRNLRFADGQEVTDSDEMLVVTNSYRANGGGYFSSAAEAGEVASTSMSVRDTVAEFMAGAKPALQVEVPRNFRLSPLGGVEVEVAIGAGALDHPQRLEKLSLRPLKQLTTRGFQRFALTL